jgi:4,5:9,10-diseco-3-hydroxy-5,9,17-trioxoandrosta-1(10),2-diene-4-oate hydrolase
MTDTLAESATAVRPANPPFGSTVPVGEDGCWDLHYLEQGSGQPIVLVHGSGPGAGGHANFSANIGVLAEAGFRVLVPDLIGFGWSSKPDDMDYTLDMFVETFRQFLDHVGIDKAVLVGNSLGGAVVMGFALAYPERVSKLVLMAPGGIESRERYFQMEGIQSMVSRFVGAGFDAGTMAEILKLLAFDTRHISPGMVESRLAVYETQPKAVLGRIIIPDLTDRLGDLKMPIIGFWGWEDKFCPATGAQKIVSACPDARMTLFSRCGHWVMIERADAFNRDVIDFARH